MSGTGRALPEIAIILTIGILCVIPFAGCGGGGGGGGGGGQADVTGRVVDDGTLNPVPNATVSASGKQATTSGAGSFTLLGVSTGTVAFTVTAATYDQLNDSRTLSAGVNNAGDFFIKPARISGTRGHVGGSVRTVGGAAVGNASVNVLASSVNFAAKSKTNGTFTVYNVPFGPGTLSAFGSAGEGSFGPAVITVDQPEENVGNLTLTTGPPPPPPFP